MFLSMNVNGALLYSDMAIVWLKKMIICSFIVG